MLLNVGTKILVIFTSFTLFIASFTFILKDTVMSKVIKSSKNCILISPYKNINYKVYGTVFEPTLTLPILTKSGYKNISFLVDSGAVVSTIPNSFAKEIYAGNIENLERTVLKGYGGGTSFGYVGNMKAKFASREMEIPVVFSELDTTRPILGRKGFLELMTTLFDHKGEILCIVEEQ